MTEEEIELVKRLVDKPIEILRESAFDGGSYPSSTEAKRRFAGWTKGELIAEILRQRNGLSD